MLYKYSNFELKSVFLFNRPVTSQTGLVSRANRSAYRLKSFELAFEFKIWIYPILTNFRSNRSGLPEPVGGGLVRPVGKKTVGVRVSVLPRGDHLFSFFFTHVLTKQEMQLSKQPQRDYAVPSSDNFFF